MNKLKIKFLFFALLTFGISITAQETQSEWLHWLVNYRYKLADNNKDKALNYAELSTASQSAFAFYTPDVFEFADKDEDMFISLKELMALRNQEYDWIRKNHIEALESINAKGDLADYKNTKDWGSHPQIIELLGNVIWLEQNETMAKNLVGNNGWAESNPKAVEALMNNYYYLTFNPSFAKVLQKYPAAKGHQFLIYLTNQFKANEMASASVMDKKKLEDRKNAPKPPKRSKKLFGKKMDKQ